MADCGDSFMAVEAKSGATVADDMFDGLRAFDEVVTKAPGRKLDRRVVWIYHSDPERSAVPTLSCIKCGASFCGRDRRGAIVGLAGIHLAV